MNAQLEAFAGEAAGGPVFAPSSKCRACGRRLRNPKFVAVGIGPTCARKLGIQLPTAAPAPAPAPVLRVQRVPFLADVRVWREADGRVESNVPRRVVQHSPDGYECGYAGSGPADLALNILAAFMPAGEPIRWDDETDDPDRDDAPVECYRGTCSRFAVRWHQDFKFQFIASMPREGGTIPGGVVAAWIDDRRRPKGAA